MTLTDENRLFWYKDGQRLVRTTRIREAQASRESRPAERDPEGHWGRVVDGFQLSLRFDKQAFTNGEPVVATILMRNVSDKELGYIAQDVTKRPSPIHVSVWKEMEPLSLKTNDDVPPLASVRNVTLYPRTQHKYQLRLETYYNLSKAGTYVVQAQYGGGVPLGPFPTRASGQEPITSQKVTITVAPAPTR